MAFCSRCPDPILCALLVIALLTCGILGFLIVPPWQAPDEPGHYEYSRILADWGFRQPTTASRAQLQDAIIAELHRSRFWSFLHGQNTPLDNRVFLATVTYGHSFAGSVSQGQTALRTFFHYPRLSSQYGDEPALYYGAPALLLPLVNDVTAQLYIGRGWSLLLYLISVVFVFLGLKELAPGDRFVHFVGGLLVAAAPMPAYIGVSFNNDVAAIAISSATIYLLLRGSRLGWSAPRLLALAGALCFAALTKKTTLFLFPLAFTTVVLASLLRGDGTALSSVRKRWRWLAASTVLLVLSLATIASAPKTDAAANWLDPERRQPASRTHESSFTGSFSLVLPPSEESAAGLVRQELGYNGTSALRGQSLTLTAWVKVDEVAGEGDIIVQDGAGESRLRFFAEGAGWQQVTLRHAVSTKAERLSVTITNAGSCALILDEISLRGESGRELLGNPGFEQPATIWEELTARRRSVAPGLTPDLFSPQSYDWNSLKRYMLFGALTFAGFWGNFGWLTIPLHPQWYLAIAIFCLPALVGLGRIASRKGRLEGCRRFDIGVMALASLLIGLQTFVPMIGSGWQPQGRYLFPALLPLSALLTLGWREWGARKQRPILAGFLAALIIAFNQFCIWGYIWPNYRYYPESFFTLIAGL